ncbi:Thiol-disulfide isomerase or thioredoxin [Lentzea albidocapillata subsp. violacea]|uniref:Thiol-disulfide isomerase or thioredoxin n=1 Tax=Lentzea albidocapillata subsp. violacea TaxID=128104 RepID=A0A1G9S135_9PSEU|nr:TlpA disulfide reductase family protein [Lentzea albidocapillata]SDM29124.1 Thiol-disulfide isomerase or thioredoxin [Lentzea albidocapillata subsp. violacea]
MRWAILVVVLAVAAAVALWPRDDANDVRPSRSVPAQDDAALAEARQRAALEPCPQAGTGSSAGPLAGLTVQCLGSPGTVELGGALAGRTVLLNLWASWCQPCREEMPVLQEYSRQPGAVPVVGVNVQDVPSEALGAVVALGVRYPSVVDTGEAVQKALAVPRVLPVSYVVRPDGTVRQITDPLVFRTPDQVRAAVAAFGAAGSP